MAKEESVKIFRISGSFKQKRQATSFTKEYLAVTEENALAKLYSQFGSKNRVKRRQIKIQSIKEITKDEVTDPLVEKTLKSEFKIPFDD